MVAKIIIELEINGKFETISYDDGLAIYNELKKIYDRSITIGDRKFINPWTDKKWIPPPTVVYGICPPSVTTT